LAKHIGVLLMAYGSPNRLDEVEAGLTATVTAMPVNSGER
jgi:protoheme ferro-lyase